MKTIYYKDFKELKREIHPYKVIKCNEGTICLTDDYVYKILYIATPVFIHNVKKFHKFNSYFLTVPLSLIYLKDSRERIGFSMENSGNDLWTLLLSNTLSLQEKKEIALQMKEICIYLRTKRYVHGDIKLENLLYKDGILRLTDINSMLKIPNSTPLRMPDVYKTWYEKYNDAFYIDYLAMNYCMYILLNFDFDGINLIKRTPEWCDGFSYSYNKIMESENKVFDDEIYEKMKASFTNVREKLLTKDFLVDYMK